MHSCDLKGDPRALRAPQLPAFGEALPVLTPAVIWKHSLDLPIGLSTDRAMEA